MARVRRNTGPRFYMFQGDHLTVMPAPIERIVIGRHRKCHLRIPHEDVNLKHAVIERIDVAERWRLINFGTTMPCLFNGEMMEPEERREITFGDVFEIGEICFYFERVRKNAPEEHQVAIENLLEDEKASKKTKLVPPSQRTDDDDSDTAPRGDTVALDDGNATADAPAAGAKAAPAINHRRNLRRSIRRRRR